MSFGNSPHSRRQEALLDSILASRPDLCSHEKIRRVENTQTPQPAAVFDPTTPGRPWRTCKAQEMNRVLKIILICDFEATYNNLSKSDHCLLSLLDSAGFEIQLWSANSYARPSTRTGILDLKETDPGSRSAVEKALGEMNLPADQYFILDNRTKKTLYNQLVKAGLLYPPEESPFEDKPKSQYTRDPNVLDLSTLPPARFNALITRKNVFENNFSTLIIRNDFGGSEHITLDKRECRLGLAPDDPAAHRFTGIRALSLMTNAHFIIKDKETTLRKLKIEQIDKSLTIPDNLRDLTVSNAARVESIQTKTRNRCALESLTLLGCHQLSKLPSGLKHSLKTLDVSHIKQETLIAILENCLLLEELTLSGTVLCAETIAGLNKLPQLKSLILRNCEISVKPILCCPSLETLYAYSVNYTGDLDLRNCPNLKTYANDRRHAILPPPNATRIDPYEEEAPAPSARQEKSLSVITTLDGLVSEDAESNARSVVVQRNPTLRRLTLSNLSNIDTIIISDSPILTELVLTFNDEEGEKWPETITIENCPKLRRVTIADCSFDDRDTGLMDVYMEFDKEIADQVCPIIKLDGLPELCDLTILNILPNYRPVIKTEDLFKTSPLQSLRLNSVELGRISLPQTLITLALANVSCQLSHNPASLPWLHDLTINKINQPSSDPDLRWCSPNLSVLDYNMRDVSSILNFVSSPSPRDITLKTDDNGAPCEAFMRRAQINCDDTSTLHISSSHSTVTPSILPTLPHLQKLSCPFLFFMNLKYTLNSLTELIIDGFCTEKIITLPNLGEVAPSLRKIGLPLIKLPTRTQTTFQIPLEGKPPRLTKLQIPGVQSHFPELHYTLPSDFPFAFPVLERSDPSPQAPARTNGLTLDNNTGTPTQALTYYPCYFRNNGQGGIRPYPHNKIIVEASNAFERELPVARTANQPTAVRKLTCKPSSIPHLPPPREESIDYFKQRLHFGEITLAPRQHRLLPTPNSNLHCTAIAVTKGKAKELIFHIEPQTNTPVITNNSESAITLLYELSQATTFCHPVDAPEPPSIFLKIFHLISLSENETLPPLIKSFRETFARILLPGTPKDLTESVTTILRYCKAFQVAPITAGEEAEIQNWLLPQLSDEEKLEAQEVLPLLSCLFTQKGICRHRASAALLLFQYLGLPATCLSLSYIHTVIMLHGYQVQNHRLVTAPGSRIVSDLGGAHVDLNTIAHTPTLAEPTPNVFDISSEEDSDKTENSGSDMDVQEDIKEAPTQQFTSLFLPPLHQQTQAEHFALTAIANKRVLLISNQDPWQISLLFRNIANTENRNFFYVDSPETLEKTWQEIIVTPEGTLATQHGALFRTCQTTHPIIFVNWSSFTVNEMNRYKSLLDTEPTLFNTRIARCIAIVGVIAHHQQPSEPFLSRHVGGKIALPLAFIPNGLPETIARPAPANAIEVNLFSSGTIWEKCLLEGITIEANGRATLITSPLIIALEAQQPLHLVNPPKDDPAFNLWLRRLQTEGFTSKTGKHYPPFQQIICSEKAIPAPIISIVRATESTLHVNLQALFNLLENNGYQFQHVTGQLQLTVSGLLELPKNTQLVLIEPISSALLSYLLSKIQEKRADITLSYDLGLTQDQTGNIIISTAALQVPVLLPAIPDDVEKSLWFQCDDPLHAIERSIPKIPFSHIHFLDKNALFGTYFYEIVPKSDQENQYHIIEKAVLKQLMAGETVYLVGEIPADFFQKIDILFLEGKLRSPYTNQRNTVPGKLLIISQGPSPLTSLIPQCIKARETTAMAVDLRPCPQIQFIENVFHASIHLHGNSYHMSIKDWLNQPRYPLLINTSDLNQYAWQSFYSVVLSPDNAQMIDFNYEGVSYPLPKASICIVITGPLDTLNKTLRTFIEERATPIATHEVLIESHIRQTYSEVLHPIFMGISSFTKSHQLPQPTIRDFYTITENIESNTTYPFMYYCYLQFKKYFKGNPELEKDFWETYVPTLYPYFTEITLANIQKIPSETSKQPPSQLGNLFLTENMQQICLELQFALTRRLSPQSTGQGYRLILLEGASGIGKTSLLLHFLRNEAIDFTFLVCGQSIETQLTEAFHAGRIVVLDEINLDVDTMRLVTQLLQGKDLTGKSAQIQGFMIFSSQNPSSFAGCRALPSALMQAAHIIAVPDYTKSEYLFLARAHGIPEQDVADFVDEFLALKQRNDGINARNFFEGIKAYQQQAVQLKKLMHEQKPTQVVAPEATAAVTTTHSLFSPLKRDAKRKRPPGEDETRRQRLGK